MQNIDPIYIIQPVVVITVTTAFFVYWYRQRHFRIAVLTYSLLAYAGAIALKYAVQIPTINTVEDYFGQASIGLGVYYGLQTVIFEVGLAFVVARWAVKKGRLEKRDAEGYGAGLAFWENAVLLGALSLLDLVAYYAILSTNTSLAQTVYDQLSANAPSLFNAAPQALATVARDTVERFSSVLFHFAWGYLRVMAAVYNRKRLFLTALPMGFVDFLAPFVNSSNLNVFEAVVLALSVVSVSVAWYATRRVAKSVNGSNGFGWTMSPGSAQRLHHGHIALMDLQQCLTKFGNPRPRGTGAVTPV